MYPGQNRSSGHDSDLDFDYENEMKANFHVVTAIPDNDSSDVSSSCVSFQSSFIWGSI